MPFEFNKDFMMHPAFGFGMGMLAGNQGSTGQGAFANAMRSGLQGGNQSLQLGMLSSMQDLQRKRLEQEMAKDMTEQDKERQLAAMTGGSVFPSASLAEQRQMLAGYYPELMAKHLYSQTKPTGVGALRKEYTSVSKPWLGTRSAYEKVSGAQETAAGDISLIFGYMKMLDPGSTVREGEAATVEQARGVPSGVLGLYNRLVTGERLTPAQRAEFKAQAREYLSDALQHQMVREGQYQGIASRADMNIEDVVRDLVPQEYRDLLGPEMQPAAPPRASQAGPQPGDVDGGYRFKGGDPADQNNWERVTP